ncbi:MAG: ribonuclease [Gammaproteobacteria bacterium]|nr:ribonuclease [Gammaproteobacteria bacterium]
MDSRRKQTRRTWAWLIAGLVLLGAWQLLQREQAPSPVAAPAAGQWGEAATRPNAALDFLPAEAHATLALIDRGGPYPYRQDGTTFHNRERLLPERPRGHYREFTVDTPGLGHRGPRRIVTGGDPPSEWYYTDDHYNSFREFQRDVRP